MNIGRWIPLVGLVVLILNSCAAPNPGGAATASMGPDVGPDGGSLTSVDGSPPNGGSAADSSATSDSAPPATPALACQIGCKVATDCAVANTPAFDADNYACKNGLCVYTGCNTDAECQQSMGGKDYACTSSNGLKSCHHTCATPADCATASAAFDADNYACASGVCTYTGCTSDDECQKSMKAPYACKPLNGLKLCQHACTQPADCAVDLVGYDVSHFACDDGVCRYLGCAGDAECQQMLKQPTAVCRPL